MTDWIPKERTFEYDLSWGLQIEERVLKTIRQKYPSASLIHKFKGYDIWIPEINKGVEVKADFKSNYTNNMVVEVEMYGKPSGLLSTQADIWIFFDNHVFVAIEVRDIFKCIVMNKLVHTEFVGNGDTVPKKAFLINKDLLFSYGKQLKEYE